MLKITKDFFYYEETVVKLSIIIHTYKHIINIDYEKFSINDLINIYKDYMDTIVIINKYLYNYKILYSKINSLYYLYDTDTKTNSVFYNSFFNRCLYMISNEYSTNLSNLKWNNSTRLNKKNINALIFLLFFKTVYPLFLKMSPYFSVISLYNIPNIKQSFLFNPLIIFNKYKKNLFDLNYFSNDIYGRHLCMYSSKYIVLSFFKTFLSRKNLLFIKTMLLLLCYWSDVTVIFSEIVKDNNTKYGMYKYEIDKYHKSSLNPHTITPKMVTIDGIEY